MNNMAGTPIYFRKLPWFAFSLEQNYRVREDKWATVWFQFCIGVFVEWRSANCRKKHNFICYKKPALFFWLLSTAKFLTEQTYNGQDPMLFFRQPLRKTLPLFNCWFLEDCKTADDFVISECAFQSASWATARRVEHWLSWRFVVPPTEAMTFFCGRRSACSLRHGNKHCSNAKMNELSLTLYSAPSVIRIRLEFVHEN